VLAAADVSSDPSELAEETDPFGRRAMMRGVGGGYTQLQQPGA
jgi:hypothetical protein